MTFDLIRCWAPLMAGLLCGVMLSPVNGEEPLLFVTSFAGGEDGAIHAFRLQENGSLKPASTTTEIDNPFFLALSPKGRFLYSIHAKAFGGKEFEEVAAFTVDAASGKLTALNRQSAEGSASCYLSVDATGRTLLAANYTSGSIASLPIKKDGSLGKAASFFEHQGSGADPSRQKSAKAHSIITSPDNRFVIAADLGIDQVLVYKLDPQTAKLTPNDPPFVSSPAGSGPRHLTFGPSGEHLYAINELNNTLSVFRYEAKSGKLTLQQTVSTVPEDFDGKSYCADVKITPDGRYLYGTNRGHDSIAAYKIAADGQLSLIAIEPSLGKGPQNLAIAPDGQRLLCANMPGNNLVVFNIDSTTGRLKAQGEPIEIKMPSCILFLP